jgi:hypothetical protein
MPEWLQLIGLVALGLVIGRLVRGKLGGGGG